MGSVPQICTRAKLIASPNITVLADCGSSPMKQSLRDLNIAFAHADVDAILDFFTEDIRWRIVGEREIRGKPAVRDALEAMAGVRTRELVIHSIITDGREGAINGVIKTEPGGVYAFCDVCRFDGNGKIDLMKSYSIEIKKES